MAVTHTGGDISPLHYLALARDADGVELGGRENLKALFDAGLSGDDTTLYMRVRIQPDGRLVAEPCQPQLDMSLSWALGDDLFVINLSSFESRTGAFVLVKFWYCPENQELIEYYSTHDDLAAGPHLLGGGVGEQSVTLDAVRGVKLTQIKKYRLVLDKGYRLWYTVYITLTEDDHAQA